VKKGGNTQTVLIVSCCLPFDSLELPPTKELRDIISFAQKENLPIIIGMDANSHHVVWGSTDINSGGVALLEYIASTNLDILNQGTEPTFVTKVRREVLDITTLASSWLNITRWRVLRDDSASDHRYITFELASDACEKVKYRNPKHIDWGRYTNNLSLNLQNPPKKIRTRSGLVKATNELHEAIINVYQEACPEKVVTNRRPILWWSNQLENLRKGLRRQFNRAMKTGLSSDWVIHSDLQKE
jgi:hypothetical protein